MTRKKILTLVVVVALLIASLTTIFIGCKPKNPTPPADFFEVIDKVIAGFEKKTGSAKIDKFNLSGGLDIDLNGTKFSIVVKANIDLKEKENTYNNQLGLQIKKGDEEIMTISYIEKKPTVAGDASDKAYDDRGNNLFIKTKKNGGDKVLGIKVPSIKAVLQAKAFEQNLKNPIVDADWVGEQVKNAGVDGILKMLIVAVDEQSVKMSKDSASFSLPLTALLGDPDKLGDLISGFLTQDMMDALGIAIDPSKLTSYLPSLALNLNFTFKDDAIESFGLGLDLGKKTIDIKHTDDSDFVKIDITKDIKLKMTANFSLNDSNFQPIRLSKADMDKAEKISVLNATAGGELSFEKGLFVPKSKLAGLIEVNIPDNAKYDFNLAVDYDPSVLLDMRKIENHTYNTPETNMFYFDANNVKKDLYVYTVYSEETESNVSTYVSPEQYNALPAESKVLEPKGIAQTRTLDIGKLLPQILQGIGFADISIKGKDGTPDLIDIKISRDQNDNVMIEKLVALGLTVPAGGIDGIMKIVGAILPKPDPNSYAKYDGNPEIIDNGKEDEDIDGGEEKPEDPLKQFKEIGVYINAIMVSLTGGELNVKANDLKVAAGSSGETIEEIFFSISAGIKLNKNGLTISAHLQNGGTKLAASDKIETKFNLVLNKVGYGTAKSCWGGNN